jgi:hypothetical protein
MSDLEGRGAGASFVLSKVALALVGSVLGLAGCAKHDPPQVSALGVNETLATCSSFTDAADTRMLDFELPNTVTLTTLQIPADGRQTEDVWNSNHVTLAKGSFRFDERTKTITISVGGINKTYLVFSPPGITGCMLLSGSTGSADLDSSWFGDADQPEEDDDHDDPN